MTAVNFRNFESLNLTFTENKTINTIIAPNGMGKSNFLESIYYFSYLRSFRSVLDKELIKKGEQFFLVECDYLSGSVKNNFKIKYRDKKEILFNNKKVHKSSDILGNFLSVLFCNEDINIISGTPFLKRKFFDIFISIVNPKYLFYLKQFIEILKQKNFILKNKTKIEMLSIYNKQLSEIIFYIEKKRKETIEEYNRSFQSDFYTLGLFKEKVKIIYSSSFKNDNTGEEVVFKKLEENKEKEIALGYSILGPHRDSYLFLINGVVFNKYASLGQTRLAALVLKLIQAEFYKIKFNVVPVLLFDDVILEIDREKQKRILKKIESYKQLFFTFTDKEYLNLFEKKEDINLIEVEYGKIK